MPSRNSEAVPPLHFCAKDSPPRTPFSHIACRTFSVSLKLSYYVPELSDGPGKNWAKLADELEVATRRSRVRGPISAAIATLFDHGFEPRAYNSWVDPEGWIWKIDYDVPNLAAASREVLSHHML